MNPPPEVIERARVTALQSPCAKSRRGVVTFTERASTFKRGAGRGFKLLVVGAGFNGPPGAMVCDGSEACRKDCPKRCVHAEARALRAGTDWHRRVYALDMLHVEVDADGAIMPCDGPKCWQCSREILDSGLIQGMWLYEAGASKCLGCNRFEDSSQLDERVRRCMECGGDLTRVDTWRRYTAEEFHQATIARCGIHAGAAR